MTRNLSVSANSSSRPSLLMHANIDDKDTRYSRQRQLKIIIALLVLFVKCNTQNNGQYNLGDIKPHVFYEL
jgi:hypothetical protein